MTSTEHDRFKNLLLMAKESPFKGERRNALDAAERIARRYNMTIEEAARFGSEPMQNTKQRAQFNAVFQEAKAEADVREQTFSEISKFYRNVEDRARTEKARHEEALEAAYARGLDANERRQRKREARQAWQAPQNNRRRDPLVHARVLLRETRLPISDIASICGLDIWTVVGLKLKMRRTALN